MVDVLKREEWFPGKHMHLAPDLTLVLRDHGFVSIRNREPAVIDRERPAGTHHPDGIFLAYGHGIAAAGRLARRQIVDVAPTLLHSLGLPVPEDFEGEVPAGFFSPEWLAAHPVRRGEATRAAVREEASEEIDEGEKKQLIEQLQMLGYME